jgi:hypothetical protein
MAISYRQCPPTGGDADLFHNRVTRLGESPVGAGRARDYRNVEALNACLPPWLSRAWRAPTGGNATPPQDPHLC